VEHGKAGQRGFLASWVQAGVPVGLLLATGVFRLLSSSMSPESFLSWGWRVPFLIGILLLGVGLFIRLHVMESPVFAEAQKEAPKKNEMPILEVLRRYPRNVLLAMGARFAENAFFYVVTIFVLTYATKQAGFAQEEVLRAVLIGSAVQFVVVPLFGLLSDKIGRRPVYLAGAVFVVLFAFPFFWLIDLKNSLALVLAVTIGLIGHSAMYGPQAAFFSELFGTRVRYSGASFGYQLASPLAGGLAPLIATALLAQSGGKPWPVALYLIGMAAITILSVWLAEETSTKQIDQP
jgi:MFS family permease